MDLDILVKNATQEYLRDLIEYYKVSRGDRCLSYAQRILNLSAHIPSVRNVVIAATRCTYYSRLMSLGVRVPPSDFFSGISGKGEDIHKVLGLAILCMTKNGYFTPYGASNCVASAFKHLEDLKLLAFPNQKSNTINVAEMLIDRLIEHVFEFAKIVGANHLKLIPIVEQFFISYPLHMKGSPDLILEDPENRAAIVIDWKTGGSSTTRMEQAQVYAYALMEAFRLGYRGDEIIRVVLGEPGSYGLSGVKVLPVIIKPSDRSQLLPHPALASGSRRQKELYERGESLIRRILTASGFLSLISSNHYKLGVDINECKNEQGLNILRVTPSWNILPRGVPKKQNKYPCAKNGKVICPLSEECKAYYGQMPTPDRAKIEKDLWRIRFTVWDKLEEILYVYRALEYMFLSSGKDWIIDQLRRNKGIVVNLNNGDVDTANDPSQAKKIMINITIHRREMSRDVTSPRTIPIEKRYDIAYDFEFDGPFLKLKRPLNPTIDYADIEGVPIIRAVKPGRTALISLLDGPTPTTSINFHGRVDEANPDPINNVFEYVISTPSRVLRYQLEVFKKHIESRGVSEVPIFIVEANIDLTNIELRAIDTVQRWIRKKYGNIFKSSPDDLKVIAEEAADDMDSLLDIVTMIFKR